MPGRDAAGSCHNYKELELNAKNVVWNLLLTRPYADGGGSVGADGSGATDEEMYNLAKARSAALLAQQADWQKEKEDIKRRRTGP